MDRLPPNEAGHSPLAFLMRFAMAVVSLIALAVLITFGIAVVLVFIGVFIIGGIWVRWKAGREGMDWRHWVRGRMTRGMHEGVRAGWRESMRSEAEVAHPPHENDKAPQDFYTTMTTIEGEYAVVDEASRSRSSDSNS